MADLHDPVHPYRPSADPGPDNLLLVWDAPNIDMGLGAILSSRPTSAHRPRFDAVGRWLLNAAAQQSEAEGRTITPEATVFTNVTGAEQIRSWVDALRNVGFAVFAKPKTSEESDVDPDMLAHIARRRAEGVLRGVVVASADGQNFQPLLEEIAAEGIPVTVLGFHEHAAWAVDHPDFTFYDLEEIPGVFRDPLPRITLDNLPDEGAWLQPFRPLANLLDK